MLWANSRKLIPTCYLYISNCLQSQSGRNQFFNKLHQLLREAQHEFSQVALFIVLSAECWTMFFLAFSEMKLITVMHKPAYWYSTFQFIKGKNLTRIISNNEFYLKNYIVIMPQGIARKSDKSANNVDFIYWSG